MKRGKGIFPLSIIRRQRNVPNVVFDISHEALDAIGGLQTPAQLVKEPRPMEHQSLFQALLKGTSGLAVDLLQFGVEIGEPLFGSLVGRLEHRNFCVLDPLELPSPRFLVLLRKATQNVLALVPLAALDLGAVSEDLVDGFPQRGIATSCRERDQAQTDKLTTMPQVALHHDCFEVQMQISGEASTDVYRLAGQLVELARALAARCVLVQNYEPNKVSTRLGPVLCR